MKLDNTVVLVTGGARRVGRSIVLEMARAGCNVAIHYRHSLEEAGSLAAEVEAMGRLSTTVPGDLCDPTSWATIVNDVVRRLGRLDVLVNNASVFLTEHSDSLDGFDSGQWESILRVNLIAPMALSHAAFPHLKASGQGSIVNLCDISADRPWPDHLAYCVSKAALVALTRGLSRAMAPKVRVNGVAPGIAAFPEEYSDSLRRALAEHVPLGREGTPEEVADLVRFLVERGEYITGQVIPIDGGRSTF